MTARQDKQHRTPPTAREPAQGQELGMAQSLTSVALGNRSAMMSLSVWR
jgi:hypothetical protein